MVSLFTHYNKEVVKREIYNFSKQRWIALYGNTMYRYDKKDNPLTFENEDDVPKKVLMFNARTIYATAGKYEVVNRENVSNDKLIAYTPFFDIDTKIDKWEYAIRASEIIVSYLEKEGVNKSVYLLWSGEGIHVRINERAIGKSYDPLTAAHAIVQYVINKTKDELQKLSESSGGVLKVEDLIDAKRIFTTPLSFHKELDYVTVCFSPDKLSKFSLEWAKPESFIHEEGLYERFEENEAEDLLIKAIAEYKPTHESVKIEEKKEIEGKIGRFQVMGILQAARYYVLFGDLDKAKSFGLNRAIFYAWAKHYGKSFVPKTSKGKYKVPIEAKSDRKLVNVAGEEVYQDVETGYFVIGDKPQKPEDYDKEIRDKIDHIIPYEEAWKASVDYVSSFSRQTLINQREFYEKVYLPVRDAFVEKVVKRKRGGIDTFL
ncbi:hypothetical protein [Sulfurisphaera ohwakuensis]|uniref:hypothetical protein n=1 Tax=Sulfurisphaera ohwakuensis TaxID=69656 RepID=UPI0036F35208